MHFEEPNIDNLAVVDHDTHEMLASIERFGKEGNVYEHALFWIIEMRTEQNVLVEPITTARIEGMPPAENHDDTLYVRVDRTHEFDH